MRPSNGESNQRGREVLSVSWESQWERGKMQPESRIQNGVRLGSWREARPVTSSFIFLQLAESDFASTFRLLTVFAYGTYADYLGNQRAGALE